MVKKSPIYTKTNEKRFPTKGAARKFAVDTRKKALQAGQTMRYEVQLDETTGEWKVRERHYIKNKKGRLM